MSLDVLYSCLKVQNGLTKQNHQNKFKNTLNLRYERAVLVDNQMLSADRTLVYD